DSDLAGVAVKIEQTAAGNESIHYAAEESAATKESAAAALFFTRDNLRQRIVLLRGDAIPVRLQSGIELGAAAEGVVDPFTLVGQLGIPCLRIVPCLLFSGGIRSGIGGG